MALEGSAFEMHMLVLGELAFFGKFDAANVTFVGGLLMSYYVSAQAFRA